VLASLAAQQPTLGFVPINSRQMSQNFTNLSKKMKNTKSYINTLDSPVLLMQTNPRQVVTANEKACELFGKDLAQIEAKRGGQVFDCVHSFSEAGCGLDSNCEDCKIKNAVIDTFLTGEAHDSVQTVLDIKKRNGITPYILQVSTKIIGEFALLTIEKYEENA
jgi:transcriptional regulator of aromatic amino acid metabolism